MDELNRKYWVKYTFGRNKTENKHWFTNIIDRSFFLKLLEKISIVDNIEFGKKA